MPSFQQIQLIKTRDEAFDDMLAALEAVLPDLEAAHMTALRASKTWEENERANALMFKAQATRAAIAKARGLR